MKVLLHQNLAHDLRDFLRGHDVRVAPEMGWDRLENGALLKAAEDAGFDAIITADRNIRYQNRLAGRRIALVVLSTNHWPTLLRDAHRVLAALDGLLAGTYVEVAFEPAKLRRRPAADPKPER